MSQVLLVIQKVEDGNQHMHLYVGGCKFWEHQKPLSVEPKGHLVGVFTFREMECHTIPQGPGRDGQMMVQVLRHATNGHACRVRRSLSAAMTTRPHRPLRLREDTSSRI